MNEKLLDLLKARWNWLILATISLTYTFVLSMQGPETYIGWARLRINCFALGVIALGLVYRLGAIVFGAAVGMVMGIGSKISGLHPSTSWLVIVLFFSLIGGVVEALLRWRNSTRELARNRDHKQD